MTPNTGTTTNPEIPMLLDGLEKMLTNLNTSTEQLLARLDRTVLRDTKPMPNALPGVLDDVPGRSALGLRIANLTSLTADALARIEDIIMRLEV